MEKDMVILLTGTINPNNMTFTQLQDAGIRKSQYIESIQFWLKESSLPIVFVENSGVDLSSYFPKEIQNNRLEILTFSGNNFDRSLGKGFGELNCLEFAYTNSKYVSKSKFIFKVTGRYKVLNFSVFQRKYDQDTTIDLMVDFKWNLSFCDSRFFGFRPSFLPDFLLNYKSIINDSKEIFFEHILSKAVHTAIANEYVYSPFVTLPRIEGYSASSGAKYNSKFLHWLRYKFEYDLKYRGIGLGNLPWI